MATMQAAMKELRTLKQEETTMMNLASKISDQLNRLKVEELALQNIVRLQNEELERKSRGSQRSINRSLPVEMTSDEESLGDESDDEGNDGIKEYLEKGDKSGKVESVGVVPLNLVVNKYHEHETMEEEEEEDEEETEMPASTADDEYDIERFVNSL